MNSWNLIGLLAWVILIAYLIFIVWHIRQRHIKAIVKSGKQVRGSVVLIDIAEVLVFAIAAIGMVWVSWLRPIDYRDSRAVAISHSAEHLILQTGEDHSFYVRVQT
ncbi:MAG: LVIS_2131 family protein, partial [Lactobacillaceae bacterium]